MHSLTILFLSVATCVIWVLWRTGRREPGLPPGPPTVPILGNMLMFPKTERHLVFTTWARQYGPIFSLKMCNDTIIVLSDAASTKELLDVRGASSSDRPKSHAIDLITNGLYLSTVGYGSDVFRVGRKAMLSLMSPQGLQKQRPRQQFEVQRLLNDLLTEPGNFYDDIFRASFSATLYNLYGAGCDTRDCKLLADFDLYIRSWFHVLTPGVLPPVDLLPFLKLIPEKMAAWKTACKRVQNLQRDWFDGLFSDCERRIKQGDLPNCYIADTYNRQKDLGFTSREMLVYHVGTVLDGGSDTTAAFLRSMILLMVAYPECQEKAYREIDSVIGSSRIPNFDDPVNLPYVRAIIKETHRFRPVSLTSVPHVTSVEQEYRGYRIPKGSLIYQNIWGTFRDPDFFENVDQFIPERYILTEHGTKPGVDASDFRASLAFGAGRRLCPGYHMASSMIEYATVALLWAFHFSLAKGSDGSDIPVDIHDYDLGVTSTPHLFKCTISPRSPEKAALIRGMN